MGYKLHAWATKDARIPAFAVRSLNEGEAKLAREILSPLPEAQLILADANYDSQHSCNALGARGRPWLTPLKRIAVNPGPLRRLGPHRREDPTGLSTSATTAA